MNWCSVAGSFQAAATDIRMDATWDTLTAQVLLSQAGLAQQQRALAGVLVQAAHQLAPLAAACDPAQRAAWAQQARQTVTAGFAAQATHWEAAVARIAVEWAAVSAYPSDLLFTPERCLDIDCLVMVQGIATDPLIAGLQPVWAERFLAMPFIGNALSRPAHFAPVRLHACCDGEDEAQRCAAQAIAHIAQGVFPVALVSSDRALTRRVRALLDGAGVAIRDENGWKHSTGHAGAGVMALLQACEWNATSDQVLKWLKICAPDFLGGHDALEAALRRDQVRDWRHAAVAPTVKADAALQAGVTLIDAMRSSGRGQHTLAQWLGWMRKVLVDCGMWPALEADTAGSQLLQTLHLQPGAQADALLGASLWSAQRLNLTEFSRWVSDSLESASFKPQYPITEQLVILPMSQMLGRPFAAVLLAGCDEVRLSPAPEPPGHWTGAQRTLLGLPSRAVLQTNLVDAWHCALQMPVCDVFWRTSDEGGETLLASPLVQRLQIEPGCASVASEPRVPRTVNAAPTHKPQPTAARLPVAYLTQGAYDDLRKCPYRFFALRQLDLKPVDELETEVDKRDFGVWLHAVLHHFHGALAKNPDATRAQRQVLLDAANLATTQSMGLDDAEFLPFAASWPALCDAYLDWLGDHEKQEQAVYASGETDHVLRFGSLEIRGRIDRIDQVAGGAVMVLDYKTENADKTRARAGDPLEDTQMAFYAALLPHDTLRGAYINLAEKKVRTVEQGDIVEARDALIEGMVHDMQRVAEGASLPALGEGGVCDFCQARGLCRKDFWS